MVVIITRWTALCGCIFELESDPDSDKEEERNNKFLLANSICIKHQDLKSKARKANHNTKSKRVMDILQTIKDKNLAGSHANMARHPDKSIAKLHSEQVHQQVIKHNDTIHNEWSELTSNIHAHDEHIYDIVLKENQIPTEE